MLVLILVFCALTTAAEFDDDKIYKYLQRYGYVKNTTEVGAMTNLKTSLIAFQERYNLPVDGAANVETIKLLKRPRCTVGENQFTLQGSKWKKHTLKWYFPQGLYKTEVGPVYLNLIRKAFNVWQNGTNLKFEMVTVPTPHPDIAIYVTKRHHENRYNCQGNGPCPFDFEKSNLGHSYFPNEQGTCVEIHMNKDENWYLGEDEDVPDDQVSFLMVLTHEIGHALGLRHSGVAASIMYPWYQERIGPLSADDINAMEVLYGRRNLFAPIPKTHPSPPPSTNEHSTARATPPSPRLPPKNLCDLTTPDFMFLAIAPNFQTYRFYIANGKYLWKINLDEPHIPQPENIENYLPFGFDSRSHVYFNAVGELIVFSRNNGKYYTLSFPQLDVLRNDYIDKFPPHVHINAAFQSYTGRSYVFFNNESYFEINTDENEMISRGLIRDGFPGVPGDITAAFRYIDGNLYFLRENIYFKYNEFQKKVLEAGSFHWNLFGILCPDETMLQKLHSLLSKIVKLYE